MHDIQRFGGDGGVCTVCAQLEREREPQKQAKKLDAFDVLQRATSQRVAPTTVTITSSRPRSDPAQTQCEARAWARVGVRVRFGVPFCGYGHGFEPRPWHISC